MPPELTPRDGAKLPPKNTPPTPGPIDPAIMAEIESMSKAEANALNTLANASMQTAEMVSIMAETLEELKDILVKVCQHTHMPLPARIADAIALGEYNPDETGDEDEEDDETADVPKV